MPTPNADVIYAMSYLNLKQDGPLVVQAPPGVLGMLSDFSQRPLTDVGLVGADKGEGGQFLLVLPHNDGPPLPSGYTSAATANWWPGVTRLCAWCENPIPARAQGCRLLLRRTPRPADSSNARRPESAGYEMAGALRGAQRLDELLLVHC